MSGPARIRGTTPPPNGDAAVPSSGSPRPPQDRGSPHGPGFVRARRRALALAGGAAIAPGVRAAPGDPSQAEPPVQVRTGWLLRPDDR